MGAPHLPRQLGMRLRKLFCAAGMGGARARASEADAAFVRAALAARGGAAVPDNFQATAPGPSGRPGRMPQAAQRSPQTTAFLELLGLPYNLEPALALRGDGATPAPAPGLVPGRPAGSGAAAHGGGLCVLLCLEVAQGILQHGDLSDCQPAFISLNGNCGGLGVPLHEACQPLACG